MQNRSPWNPIKALVGCCLCKFCAVLKYGHKQRQALCKCWIHAWCQKGPPFVHSPLGIMGWVKIITHIAGRCCRAFWLCHWPSAWQWAGTAGQNLSEALLRPFTGAPGAACRPSVACSSQLSVPCLRFRLLPPHFVGQDPLMVFICMQEATPAVL